MFPSLLSTRSQKSRQTRRQSSATLFAGTKDKVRALSSSGSDENRNACAVGAEPVFDEPDGLVGRGRNVRLVSHWLAVGDGFVSELFGVAVEMSADKAEDSIGCGQNAGLAVLRLAVAGAVIGHVGFDVVENDFSIKVTR